MYPPPPANSLNIDYVFHLASNANPRMYALQPIETLITNILGTKNILDFCKNNKVKKLIFSSSAEVFGEIKDKDIYKESDYGFVDIDSVRSCYPEGKRSAEVLIRAYNQEYDVNSVIVRFHSVYGATMLKTDNRVQAQFIRNALNKENIVLKSKGEQVRSFTYVFDIVSAMLFLIEKGKNNEAYNISNKNAVSSIAQLAQTVAKIANTKVVFDLPSELEIKGSSKAQNCILNCDKINKLGWYAKYGIEEGFKETIEILHNVTVAQNTRTCV